VRFGGLTAVDGVCLRVGEGDAVGIVGPNGSGKSTLLNALCGLVPASGRLQIDGAEIPLGQPGRSAASGLQRIFQSPQECASLSCIENVALASRNRRFHGLAAAWLTRPAMWANERQRWRQAAAALDRVGLLHRAEQPASVLSYGERRMLEFARAIAGEPHILVMDEPSAGLNASETADLQEVISSFTKDGLTLLVVEHKVEFLHALCQRLIVLELGRRIAEGTPDEVWKDPQVANAYLGTTSDA
jgi:branched-chain amino acid transport system ATP-binding protein